MHPQTFCVEVRCIACKLVERIYVRPADYINWSTRGVHAQDAFPYLTDDEREALISGMCLDCIEEMYSDLDEDDEEFNEIPMGDLDPYSDFPEYESDYYVDQGCD